MAARGLGVAAPAGCEDDGAGVDRGEVAVLDGERRAPALAGGLERGERVVLEARGAAGFVGLAERLRDRVAGAVADLEQPLARCAAAAREAVAAVLAGEGAAELLEPVDRALRVTDEGLDEARVRGLVRRAHDVLGVQLRRVVGAEGGLDPALGLGRVVRLDRALGRERDARSGAIGGDGGSETRGTAADHEHVESRRGLHPRLEYQVSLFVALQSLISLGRLGRRRKPCDRIAPWPGSPT